MKYIIFKAENAERNYSEEFGVTFPSLLTHKDVAEMVEHVKVQPDGPFAGWWAWPKAVRAGFVAKEGFCTGHSESLGMKSGAGDYEILNLPKASHD